MKKKLVSSLFLSQRLTSLWLVFLLGLLSLGQPFLSFVQAENQAGSGGNNEEVQQLNDKIEEKKKRIAELEKSIEAYKQEIAKKRLESVSLSNQIAILDNRTAELELDIEATNERLGSLELEIQTLELLLEDKETTISRQKEILSELVRNIHYQHSKNFIEIVAAYDSFSEFYSQYQFLQTVEKDLGRSARLLRVEKEEMEGKKEEQEKVQKSFEETKKELEEKKSVLGEQIDYKSNLLTQTQSSELKYKTLVGSLKSQYQQIEGEISGIEREVRSRLEAEDKLGDLEQGDDSLLSWPTQSRYITARFHDSDYPFRHVFEHSGIDIRAGQGTPLKASASGYVARAKHCSLASCYSFVMLIHSGGVATVYGHMSAIYVQEDQFVTRGDVIGLSGGTPGTVGAGPFVTGPHLHFEVRENGVPVNPLNYLVKDY